MSIKVILPVPDARAVATSGAPAHAWRALPSKPVVGLVDNAKTGAAALLDAVGRALVHHGAAASYFVYQKATASYSLTNDERAAMLARAHVIVSGVGD
jgi:hypothetical protein